MYQIAIQAHPENLSSIHARIKHYSRNEEGEVQELLQLEALIQQKQKELSEAEQENRLAEMIPIFHDLLDSLPLHSSSPMIQLFVYTTKTHLLFHQSMVYEKLGEWESALECVEQTDCLPIPQADDANDYLQSTRNYSLLRKGALLFALRRTEEAVQLLRNHPPQNVETVLLYKWLEQKFSVSLLSSTNASLISSEPSQKAETLILTGHYEEAAQLLEEKPYLQQLYASALTLLGRTDEASAILEKEVADKPYLEISFEPDYSLLLILLNKPLPDPLPWSYDTWEQFYQFPLRTFWNI